MADSARLALTPERMRTLGYRVVDMLVRRHTRLSCRRVAGAADRATMESLLREPMPRSATDFERVLARVERDVFTHAMYADHPRFFATVLRLCTVNPRTTEGDIRSTVALPARLGRASAAGQLATVARMVRETWPWLPAAPRLPTATREYRM